jgi:hypothetical protein
MKVKLVALAQNAKLFARRAVPVFAAVCALSLVQVAAHATGTANDGTAGGVTYGLGQLGGPTAVDFQTAASGVVQSVAPVLPAVIPPAALLMAILIGVRTAKRIIKMGASG